MDVKDSDLAKLINERDHLRAQVTELQERCTELALEGRELRCPWVIIESDFESDELLAVRLWASEGEACNHLDVIEERGLTGVRFRTRLGSGEDLLKLHKLVPDYPGEAPASACCGAPVVQAEGKTIPDHPVCSKCQKPAGV
jgi:hypothetical protein